MLWTQLLAKVSNTEVVRPDLAMSSLDRLILVGTLKLDTEAVYNTWARSGDLLIFGHAADPFPTIAKTPDTLHLKWTGPGGREEIPN